MSKNVAMIGLSVEESGVFFRSLGRNGEYLGRTAVSEKYSGGCALRLYDNIRGLVLDMDCEDAGEAGFFATMWCQFDD